MNAQTVEPEASTAGSSIGTDAGDGGTADPESGDAPDELPLDVIFDILKNRRRRLVLRYLVEESESTTLSDLAEHIAALENSKPEQALTSAERKRVYVCLYQCHLPKMDDTGIIDFESDRGTVELANDTEQFTQYIDVETGTDGRDWPQYYVALAVAGGVAFVAQQLLLPIDLLSGVLIGVFLGMFINLALEHALQSGLLQRGRGTFGLGGTVETN